MIDFKSSLTLNERQRRTMHLEEVFTILLEFAQYLKDNRQHPTLRRALTTACYHLKTKTRLYSELQEMDHDSKTKDQN